MLWRGVVLFVAFAVAVVSGQPDSEADAVCTLCPDGSPLDEDKADVVIATDDDGGDLTCALFSVGAASVGVGTDACRGIQASGVVFCGCPPVFSEDVCTLCPDGSMISEDKFDVVIDEDDGEPLTCRAFVLGAFAADVDSEACAGIRAAGVAFCGCPAVEPDEDRCSLCVDGSPIDSAFANVDLGGGATCNLLGAFLPSQEEAGTAECRAYQATAGFLCGCDYDPAEQDAEFNVCRVCGPPGTTLPDPFRIVKLPGLGQRDTCAFREAELATEIAPESGCEGERRDAIAEACCSCDDSSSNVQVLERIPGGREGCAWLAEQDADTVDVYCSNFGRIRRACRTTCDAPCRSGANCDDSEDFSFPTFDIATRSCRWLSRRNDAKKKKLCKFSPEARQSCRLTCDACP